MTSISYSIANHELVRLRVFNVMGQELSVLVNEIKEAGTYSVEWDASSYPSGVYFYRLTAGSFSETRKMLLVR